MLKNYEGQKVAMHGMVATKIHEGDTSLYTMPRFQYARLIEQRFGLDSYAGHGRQNTMEEHSLDTRNDKKILQSISTLSNMFLIKKKVGLLVELGSFLYGLIMCTRESLHLYLSMSDRTGAV